MKVGPAAPFPTVASPALVVALALVCCRRVKVPTAGLAPPLPCRRPLPHRRGGVPFCGRAGRREAPNVAKKTWNFN